MRLSLSCVFWPQKRKTTPVQPAERLIPLNDLLAGQSAQIGRIVGHVDHVHRLEELGLRRGTRVEMFRPGNPCIIRMAGNKVCLRADHLLNVLVSPTDVPPMPC